MLKTKRAVLILTVLATGSLAPFDAPAQAAKKVWKVGILWHAAGPEEEAVMYTPFMQGMRELGYVEGRNLQLEQTYADEHYERFPAQARELVERKVDIILASVGQAAAAAKSATRTIPIVFGSSGDPVKLGLVESLRRPGGNVTGLTTFWPELAVKHLEMLRELVPGISRVAILWNHASPDAEGALKEAQRGAEHYGLHTVAVGVASPDEFNSAFARISKADVGGLIVIGDSMLRVNSKAIIALVSASRLPAVYGPRDYTDAGGLVSYGVNLPSNFRRAAALVDKILKGASASEVPVEQPHKLELVVNIASAKMLGITLPPGILARADEVLR